MLKNRKKKGFTIVELVIVIAVIAILAAVLIPTFSNVIDKANTSADVNVVRNLNMILSSEAADEGKNVTMTDALKDAEENGYTVEKLTPTNSKNEILWDSVNDCFALKEKDGSLNYCGVTPTVTNVADYQYFKIYNTKSPLTVTEGKAVSEYSIYLGAGATNATTLTVSTGIDVGNYTTLTTINYQNTTDSTKEVIIRTSSGTLNVGDVSNIAKGQIHHYGVADKTVVYTETSCFHTYGAVGNMELKAGKAIAEKGSAIYLTKAESAAVQVTENGGKFFIPAGVTTTDVLPDVVSTIGYTATGGNFTRPNHAYEIGTLAELENFRDMVNGGFSFAGCTVELTANIKLNDGWTPIGEGSRDVALSKYEGSYKTAGRTNVFAGTFDGKNHTISNLNTKGYTPTYYGKDETVDKNDSWLVYTYGFFGILTGKASVVNLKFDNVNIDLATDITITNPALSVIRNIAKADSVAALVGYVSGGDVQISNITVLAGEIKAADAVAGIIGRWYNADKAVTLNNLTNNANITAYSQDTDGMKAAGVFGFAAKFANNSYELKNCRNTGNVSSSTKKVDGKAYGDLLMCVNSGDRTKVSLTDCSVSGELLSSPLNTMGIWAYQNAKS